MLQYLTYVTVINLLKVVLVFRLFKDKICIYLYVHEQRQFFLLLLPQTANTVVSGLRGLSVFPGEVVLMKLCNVNSLE